MITMNTRLQFYKFDQLDSTNAKARELASSGASHGTVIVAGEQTAGRGRLGRSFVSPKNSGIYLSVILRPEVIGLDNSSITLLTTAAAVAVARAVKRALDLELQIKWVNDLYLDGKKVCGILTEGVIDPKLGTFDAVIIGIGLNYREPDGGFPDELKDIAGALIPAGQTVSTEHLPTCDELAMFLSEELLSLLPNLTSREFLNEYRSRSMVLGRKVRIFPKGPVGSNPERNFENGETVTALDISEDGGLMIRRDNGTVETLTTGEISLRLL
ncbi:MAG: biotin--[Firmicutes bacterium]|nr:biotin--[acetyl-CoA-carboxylase] ligase [Bacillota bacterium]